MVLGTAVDADSEKKNTQSKETDDDASGKLFFIYTTVYFFENFVNEIKKKKKLK